MTIETQFNILGNYSVMMLQATEAVKEIVSIPWETLSVATIFALIIAGLLYERRQIKREHEKTNEELSNRITNHMEDIKELSSMNGEISNKFEKVIQSLIVILEMVKLNKNGGS